MKLFSTLLTFSLVLAWASIAKSDDVENFLDQVAKESAKQEVIARENLAQLEANLAGAEKALARREKESKVKKKPVSRKRPQPESPMDSGTMSSSELVEKIGFMKKRIEALKKREEIVIPQLDVFPPKVGAIGLVQGRTAFVVAQIAEDDSIHAIPEVGDERGNRLIMRGISTDGLADGSRFVPSNIMRVTGTEAYTTVAGARATVFVLEPLAIGKDRFEEEVTKRMDAIKKAKEKP